MGMDIPEELAGPSGVCAVHVGAGGRVVSVLGDCPGILGVTEEELSRTRLDRPAGGAEMEERESYANPQQLLSWVVLMAVRHGSCRLTAGLEGARGNRPVRAVARRTGDGVVVLLAVSADSRGWSAQSAVDAHLSKEGENPLPPEDEKRQDGSDLLAAYAEVSRCREALSLLGAYLGQLFESSHDAILILDGRGRINRANGEFLRMFDYPLEDVVGRTPGELVVPEGDQGFSDQLVQLVRTGRRVSVEGERCRRDGTRIRVSITGVPIQRSDDHIYAIYRRIP